MDDNQKDRSGNFWEGMANHYPLPFEEKTLAETNEVISLVRSKGVAFQDAKILDIACGTGIYTLPLAREAAMVTGLDSSDRMIARLDKEIFAHGLHNIHVIKSSWKDADIAALGLEKAFDIVWISMSPAVQKKEDFQKMERCSKKWCVYIGWGRKRKNALMEEAFSLHGLRYGPPPGAGVTYDLLTAAGKAPTLDYIEATWAWAGTSDEAVEDVVGFIQMQGGTADREKIGRLLPRYEQNGIIRHETYVEKGVIVWQVN